MDFEKMVENLMGEAGFDRDPEDRAEVDVDAEVEA